jgi:serine/threonine protein kinase
VQTTPLSPEDPARLGDFEIQRRIGQGGMGQVFLGESPGGEPAAVKVIRPSVVDSVSRQRFAQEVEVLKTVWGPRIAAFLGRGPRSRTAVAGDGVRRGPGSGQPREAARAAAGPAHRRARRGDRRGADSRAPTGPAAPDLKPANVLLGPNGPKIIDFGLAAFTESNLSLTASNQVVGTPICMAPEQAAGEKPLSAAVDVYTLGTLLLFARRHRALPYKAANAYMVLLHAGPFVHAMSRVHQPSFGRPGEPSMRRGTRVRLTVPPGRPVSDPVRFIGSPLRAGLRSGDSQRHRWDVGTPASTCSTCLPQPS